MEHAGAEERATTGHDTPEGQERLRLAAAKMSAAAMQGGSAEGTQVGSGAAGSGDTASPFHNLSAQTFLRLPESGGKARSASLSTAQDAAALKKSIAAAILSVRAGQSSAPGSLRVGVQGNIGARISPAFASQAGYAAPPSESLRAAASAMAKRAAARAPEVANALAAAAPAAEEGGVPGEGVPLGAPSTKGQLPTAAETHLAHRTEFQTRLRASVIQQAKLPGGQRRVTRPRRFGSHLFRRQASAANLPAAGDAIQGGHRTS